LGTKLLQLFKLLLLLSLFSSFYWSKEWIDNDILSSLIVLLCGACLPAAWNASTLVPNFTLRGMASRTPIWTALAIIPFLLLIPLGFQAQLLEAFNAWVGLFQSTDFSNFKLEQGWQLFTIGFPLALGGSYLLIVLLAFQVFSKRVVDHFFDENA
tara:strand:- start:106 stop:570 length:465 start_codon:yes stop_codon:yes gene_type:complete